MEHFDTAMHRHDRQYIKQFLGGDSPIQLQYRMEQRLAVWAIPRNQPRLRQIEPTKTVEKASLGSAESDAGVST
jgi:hypothetical protein